MKSRDVIPNLSNRTNPAKSPYRSFLKVSNRPKPSTLMMILYWTIGILMLVAIFLKLRHYFTAH